MANQRGNAYALTALCPLIAAADRDESPAGIVRDRLNDLETDADSPLARVPNTYFARLFVLDNVIYQGSPARLEALKSKYLAFSVDFHGELEPYLEGLWQHAAEFVQSTWQYCIGFHEVTSAASFTRYIKRCQVETTFYFNGSTDASLAQQLKALYLKQEFSRFVCESQGLAPAALQAAFLEFAGRTKPEALEGPTWRAGASELAHAVVGEA